MTNPVVLHGTQSNGETLPVQVDATGRLVAEGLEGPPGPQGDPFTYEDFTPEQLENLQGPPGPPGADGADGPNDLKPYGPEYSYLIIQNGKPTWVSDGSDPQPPGPTDPVMLIDQRDLHQPGLTDWGVWSDHGQNVHPPGTWDSYCREQNNFSDPQHQRTGIGALAGSDTTVRIPFTLNLIGGFEKILELTICGQWTGSSPGLSAYAKHYYDMDADNEQLTKLTPQVTIAAFGDNWLFTTATFNFYLTRPDLGNVNFTLRAWPKSTASAKCEGAWIERWRLVDPAVYLMRRHVKLLQAREALNS